jgi:hypothetical protein
VSNTQLALIEPSLLELWKVPGGGIARALRRLIPDAWSSGFEQMLKYDALIAPYVGHHYSPDQVAAALEDDALAASLTKTTKTIGVLAERHPFLLKIPTPLWMLFPRQTLRDRALKKRVARSMQTLREVADSARRLEAAGKLDSSFRASDSHEGIAWFVYDPKVPVEIARRLLAGLRARVTMDLVQYARRQGRWNLDDMKRALQDWADATDSAMGLLASIPGFVVPSLPTDQRLDIAAEIERHKQHRLRLAEAADRAATEMTTK